MIGNRTARAYRACFFGDDGELHPAGRAVLADLRQKCGFFNPCHTPGDPYTTAYKDGRKELFKRVLAMLTLDQDLEIITKVSEDDFNG